MSDMKRQPGRGGQRGGNPQRGGNHAQRRPAPKPQKGPSARDAALKALDDVVRNDAYAAQALSRQLEALRLKDEDRRLAASIFYFAVENRLYIETMLGRFLSNGRPEPLVNDILHIAAAQILFMDRVPDHAAVDEAVKQVRAAHRDGLSGLVNGVLRNLIRARDAGELTLPDPEADFEGYLSVKYSLAPAVARRMIAAYGREAEAIAASGGARGSQTVRLNATRMDDAGFGAWLDGQGLKWRKLEPGVYAIEDGGDLSRSEGYRKGYFSIQGLSAIEAGKAVGAKPGMQILDACAAPGGKTCLMAEAMGGSGRVYAWDVHEHRVALIRAAAKRLGLDNVRASVYDARVPRADMRLSMDAVLVDAPCSGLGVIAEKPDIKYRVTEASLDSLPAVQLQILEASAQAVKVGGLLVYATCTILPEENGGVVRAFLEKHPEFSPDLDDGWLPEDQRQYLRDGMIQLLPTMGCEGFFIARLRRRGS